VELVDRFHGEGAGKRARDAFIDRFQRHHLPEDLAEVSLQATEQGLLLPNLLKAAGLVSSISEARSLLRQGAVRIDGQRVEDPEQRLALGAVHVVQVGKRRLARVRLVAADPVDDAH
jgi:tyrosyl-tRNA synthetase